MTLAHVCVVIQPLDGSAPLVSDAAECAVKTAPASTFNVPHALTALQTSVGTDPLARVRVPDARRSDYQRDRQPAVRAHVAGSARRALPG